MQHWATIVIVAAAAATVACAHDLETDAAAAKADYDAAFAAYTATFAAANVKVKADAAAAEATYDAALEYLKGAFDDEFRRAVDGVPRYFSYGSQATHDAAREYLGVDLLDFFDHKLYSYQGGRFPNAHAAQRAAARELGAAILRVRADYNYDVAVLETLNGQAMVYVLRGDADALRRLTRHIDTEFELEL